MKMRKKKEEKINNVEVSLTEENIKKFPKKEDIPDYIENQIKKPYPFIIYQEEDTGYFILLWPSIPMAHCEGISVQEVIDLQEEVKQNFLREYYYIHKELPSMKPITIASEMSKNIKWFIQRGIKGYSDYDLADTSEYILEGIIMMLKELKTKENFKEYSLTINEILEGLEFHLLIFQGYEAMRGYPVKDKSKIDKAWKLLRENIDIFWY